MTVPVSEAQEVVALRRDLEALRERVEQLEGECRQNRQRLNILRGRFDSEQMAS